MAQENDNKMNIEISCKINDSEYQVAFQPVEEEKVMNLQTNDFVA